MQPGSTPKVRQDVVPTVLAPFAITLDWLTLSMHGQPHAFHRPEPWPFSSDELAPGHRFIMRTTNLRTPVFATVTYIEDEAGDKLATITADPHNLTCGPATWFHVQFANRTLYDGLWVPLYRILRYGIGCTFNCISRIDVACDGLADDGGAFMQVIARSWQGDARYYGKCDWRPRLRRAKVDGAEFGTRASNKFIRCYDKSRELKQVHRKPHVESLWSMRLGYNPMDRGERVNRLEVQLKGKEVRRYFQREGDELWMMGLADPARMLDVYASVVPSVFDFRTPADRARDAVPVVQWDWSRLRDVAPDVKPRAPRNYAMTDHQVKVGLKQMHRIAYVTCDDTVHQLAMEFAHAVGPHMVQWYEQARKRWMAELHKQASDPRTFAILSRLANDERLVDPLDEPE